MAKIIQRMNGERNKKPTQTIQQIALLSLLFLLISFFFTSCGSTPEKQIDYNFKQGIADLQLRLMPSAPPEKIYPNADFKIIVEADNQMAYDIEEGKVWLTGIVNEYFQVYPLERLFQEALEGEPVLHGRSLTSPGGEKVFLEFNGHASQPFQNAELYSAPYLLKASYRSRLEFSDTFCLNTNLYAVYDAGCTVQSPKGYSGQGAPLAVSNVEEIITPGVGASVEFRLQLSNRGRGRVERVDLVNAKLGGENIVCEFPDASGSYKGSIVSTEFGLQDAVLVCRKALPEQISYNSPLLVEFSYHYQLQQQQMLMLVK